MTAGPHLAQAEISERRRVAASVGMPASHGRGAAISDSAAHEFASPAAPLMSLRGKSVMGMGCDAARMGSSRRSNSFGVVLASIRTPSHDLARADRS